MKPRRDSQEIQTTAGATSSAGGIPREELEQRVSFAVLQPIVRLACRFGLPLRSVRHLLDIAYYREAQQRLPSMRDIMALMEVSIAKAALMSRELRHFFALPESTHGLPRRILSLLWAGPRTEAMIARSFTDAEPAEVTESLRQLVADGRVKVIPGRTTRYEAAASHYRFVEDGWLSRLEGLRSFLIAVSQAIEARFLDDDERAMVRTIRLRIPTGELPRLRRFYEEQLFPLLTELSEAGDKSPDALPIRVSMHWAPDPDSDQGKTPEQKE
jgi:hypothetical protein